MEFDGKLHRIPLKQLAAKGSREAIVAALSANSLFVVTDLGRRFEKVYDEYLAVSKDFFQNTPQNAKNDCISSHIYCNERRVPMWYCGYESTDIREAFRVPGGHQSGASNVTKWPCAYSTATTGSEHKAQAKFQRLWYKLTQMLESICDICLSKVVGASNAKSFATTDDNLSVSYTFHYHNRCRTSEIVADGQDPDLVVTEHCDPSLFVVEPCSDVDGLEVFVRSRSEWCGVEALCKPGREVVVFCGKALERITKKLSAASGKCEWLPAGGIPATPHRVRFRGGPQHENDSRYCVIFEQKYAEFYPY